MKREDSTAPVRTVQPDGSIEWRNSQGKFHRDDGPAREWPTGVKAWYRNGRLDRKDGPAMEGPLAKVWYRDGKRHRENGPAVEYADGTKEWFWRGRQLTAEEVNATRDGLIVKPFHEGSAVPVRTLPRPKLRKP